MKIFSVTILIERNGCKFGCLSESEFRICSEARFRIVEKMLLSNEELCFSEISNLSLDNNLCNPINNTSKSYAKGLTYATPPI